MPSLSPLGRLRPATRAAARLGLAGLLAAAAAGPAAALSIAPAPMVVRAGHSMGPLKLGMTEAEVRALQPKLTIAPGYTDTVLNVGPYEVQFVDGRVARITVIYDRLDHPLLLGDTGKVLPRGTMAEVARVVGGCGPVELGVGGSRLPCPGGLNLFSVGPPGLLRIDVVPDAATASTPEHVVCDAYALPGKVGDRATVSAGQTLCVESRALPQATVAADIVGKYRYNTCDRVEAKGAEPATVTCAFDGVRFVFGGPNGTLSAAEGVAIRKQ